MISTPMRQVRALALTSVIAVCLLLASPSPAEAYIGPGSGFAMLSSFFVFLTTLVLSLLSLAAWPLRMLWRLIRRRPRARPLIKRLIIVGLDGQDPELTDRYLEVGKLPNFRKLADTGSYHRLRTTFPSVSPVAWSSFSTGANPARHHKSKPFWSVLGEHGIWSTILRVPMTFPPGRFYGAQLSAPSVPDLCGTRGTFTLYTTRPAAAASKDGGARIPVEVDHDRFESTLRGPRNPFVESAPPMAVPLRVRLDRAARQAHVEVDGRRVTLEPGRMSDWITLSFRGARWRRTSGICRLLLTEMDEHVSVYVTPINIDPDKPAMPISHPSFYAKYLANRVGPFATLGLAEDTCALTEGVIGDTEFLGQAYDVDREREAMFFTALDRLRTGALVSVFDATDRIQHMVSRRLDQGAIQQVYEHNDALVGRMMARLEPGDVFMVLSAGVLFSTRRIDDADPALIDLAPTALRLFGVQPPDYMEGKPLFRFETGAGAAT